MKKNIQTICMMVLTTMGTVHGAAADMLETLERERSAYLAIAFDLQVGLATRSEKLASKTTRLLDLERMVLRNEELGRKVSAHARRAFSNADLTFLMHAAVEKQRLPLDVWLEQVGLTRETILAAHMGVR